MIACCLMLSEDKVLVGTQRNIASVSLSDVSKVTPLSDIMKFGDRWLHMGTFTNYKGIKNRFLFLMTGENCFIADS